MLHRIAALFFCLWFVALLGGGPAYAYIANDRWNKTATDGPTGTTGTPVTVTWSFAPDDTLIPNGNNGLTSNSVISFLDTTFGSGPGGSDLTLRPWFTHFDLAFARMSEVSGVTYVYEPNDDGRTFGSFSGAAGVLGVRGDVRIGGRTYGAGSNTLASNFFPDYGDMIFNTDKGGYFGNSGSNYRRLRNTTMHEAMHGLGISHVVSDNAKFLIEPTLSTAFDGPQLDDLLAMQRLYGDIYEKSGGNDFYNLATPLGPLSTTQSIAIGALGDSTVISSSHTDFLSIDDDSDTDFFSFSITDRLDVNFLLTPRGTSYLTAPQTDPATTQTTFNSLTLSNLSLALFDTNGTSLLASADSNPAGTNETILQQLTSGTYYVRVKGAQNDVQLYGLNLSATAPLPGDLLWVGNVSATWDEGVANFSSGGSPAEFYDADNVAFDDTSAVRSVNVAGNVAPGVLRITTASSYTFTGTGGVVADSLIVDGTGTVEFANSGSSSAGSTQVTSGTLRYSGNVTFSGEVQVAQSALLELAGTYNFTSGSRLTGGGSVVGDVAMPGTIAPGDFTGTLNFANDLTLSATSLLEIEIGGTAQGVDYDSLAIAGSATLDGVVEVDFTSGFSPVESSSFELLRADAGIFGEFDNILLPTLALNLAWNVVYSNFALVLQVIDPNVGALPGDFNEDGRVDAADYIVWRKTSGSASEYDLWRTNFGASIGSGGGSIVNNARSSAAPEPSALVLALLVGTMGLAIRRR